MTITAEEMYDGISGTTHNLITLYESGEDFTCAQRMQEQRFMARSMTIRW